LDKTNRNYKFSHDRIQEAAYSRIDQDERRILHSQYGLILCNHAIKHKTDDAMLFTAVDQINRAGPSVVLTSVHGSMMAQSNLQKLFEFGISFLSQNHWVEEYNLSLSLYDNAAKCCLSIGDSEKLEKFSTQVLSNARSFEDKLNIYYFSISALCHASLLEEAFSKGVQVLSMLGEDLPQIRTHDEKIGHLNETTSKLSCLSDDELL